jgi:lysophospholipase L1-like esterase
MWVTRPTSSVRPVQTVRVSAVRLFLVCAVALGGCSWDGPSAAVSVVPAGTVAPAGDDADAASASSSAGVGAIGGAIGLDGAAESASGVLADGTDGRAADGITADLAFPSTVAVVGDSLTLSARDEITAELAGLGLDVLMIDAVESRRMTAGSSSLPSGLDAIEAIRDELADEPDLWVIALGTNDVGAQVGDQRFSDDLQATLTSIGPDAPVVWVDLWIRDRRDDVVAANRLIREAIAERASPSGVVGWFAHGASDGVITGDGVHLTDRGQEVFATAIANQVRSIYHR